MKVELASGIPVRERNALLAGLPREEWDQLSPDLQRVDLSEQVVLHVPYAPIEHAYFPLSGYASLLLELSDGFRTEVGEVGNEGMLGLPLLLGQSEGTTTATVQVSGDAFRLPAAAFTAQVDRLPSLRRRVLQFAGSYVARSAQLAACNTRHTLDARLVRCLLGLHDRAQDGALAVTHEILAGLLCVHRPSLSVALSRLQRLGLIRHGTRSLVIADRAGLEAASCECYAAMRDLRGSGQTTG